MPPQSPGPEPPAPEQPAPEPSAPEPSAPVGAPGWLRDVCGAWIFYSVLPAWPGIPPRFRRIARFAPWVGAVLGGLQALLWWLLQDRVPLLAQVCLVLTSSLLLSGGCLPEATSPSGNKVAVTRHAAAHTHSCHHRAALANNMCLPS